MYSHGNWFCSAAKKNTFKRWFRPIQQVNETKKVLPRRAKQGNAGTELRDFDQHERAQSSPARSSSESFSSVRNTPCNMTAEIQKGKSLDLIELQMCESLLRNYLTCISSVSKV